MIPPSLRRTLWSAMARPRSRLDAICKLLERGSGAACCCQQSVVRDREALLEKERLCVVWITTKRLTQQGRIVVLFFGCKKEKKGKKEKSPLNLFDFICGGQCRRRAEAGRRVMTTTPTLTIHNKRSIRLYLLDQRLGSLMSYQIETCR